MKTIPVTFIVILTFTLLLINSCETITMRIDGKGGDIDKRFIQSVMRGNPANVKRYIEAGADVNLRTFDRRYLKQDGYTALMWASREGGNAEVVQLLIEAGA
jgi:hypothetical protein